MRNVKTAMVMLLAVSGSAWAESTQADWDEYAQPIVDELAACARGEVDRLWKNTDSAADLAADVVMTCEAHLDGLPAVLKGKPFNASEDQIAATLDVVKKEMHDVVAADIEKRRKE